jgi:hypothetical protein
MVQPDSNIAVFHLVSGQTVIADSRVWYTDAFVGFHLVQPYEVVAIPPSESNQLPSFAMTPFGSFYGMLPPAEILSLEPSKYYHAKALPAGDPLRQFYIDSLTTKKSNPV